MVNKKSTQDTKSATPGAPNPKKAPQDQELTDEDQDQDQDQL